MAIGVLEDRSARCPFWYSIPRLARLPQVTRAIEKPELPCVCGSHRYSLELEGLFNRHMCVNYPFRVLRCSACGLHRTDPPPYEDDATAPVYQEGLGGGEGEALSRTGDLGDESESAFVEYAEQVLQYLGRFVPAGRLLDVGCSSGSLMAAAQRAGYEVAGVELYRTAAEYAAQRTGAPVVIGTLDDVPFEADSFDAVVMSHVFEHVTDPNGTLTKLRRLLRPGGVLLLSCPNYGSVLRRVYGVNWYGLSPQFHMWQFTPASLARIVRAGGFDLELVSSRECMAYEMEPSVKGVARWALARAASAIRSGDAVWVAARKPAV